MNPCPFPPNGVLDAQDSLPTLPFGESGAATGRPMFVLAACEYSGQVREAFRAMGHRAYSCDVLDSEDNSPYHLKGDVLGILDGFREPGPMGWILRPWDLMIAFPPCTKLTRAGARWWKGQEAEQEAALNFVRKLMAAPIPGIGIENPPGAIGTRIRPADQYIQPWEHGHPEKKMTGLWLKGLPKIVPTNNVKAEMMLLPEKDRNRVHYMAPGPDRWKERSRTLPGIAKAFASQWGGLLKGQTSLPLLPPR